VTSVQLSISGMRLGIECAEPAPAGLIGDRLAPFVGDSAQAGAPDVRIVWSNADPTASAIGDLVFDPGSIWRLHRSASGEGYTAVISYSDGGRLTPRAAVIEASSAWDFCRMTEAAQQGGWHSLLNLGAGELIVRTRIVLDGGIIFHASAVDDAGRGVLFVGHSGAGKSTQSLIWADAGATVLSDDRIGVRISGGRATAYGTPWGGTAGIARNASVALQAVMVLEQHPTNELHRIPVNDALPLLLVRSFLPYWDASLVNAAMDTVQSLLEAVPVYILRCRADASVLPVVRSVL